MSIETNPDESSIQYDDICKIVGHLYLDSFRKVQNVEFQASTTIEQLRIQNAGLIKEAQELEDELEKRDGN